MKFAIPLRGKTLYSALRACGYSNEGAGDKTGELKFHRFLAGRAYPKFHIYATVSLDRKSASLNLHLDQKQPSYRGTRAHAAEHSGPAVEAEAARIQEMNQQS